MLLAAVECTGCMKSSTRDAWVLKEEEGEVQQLYVCCHPIYSVDVGRSSRGVHTEGSCAAKCNLGFQGSLLAYAASPRQKKKRRISPFLVSYHTG